MAAVELPAVSRGADRRQAPRRAEDVSLHYAGAGVIAAAIALVDADGYSEALYDDLDAAVAHFKRAEREANR